MDGIDELLQRVFRSSQFRPALARIRGMGEFKLEKSVQRFWRR